MATVGLGSVRLPVNMFQYFTVTGGPFKNCPSNMRGVKMAQELPYPCAVYIPTKDYSVPPKDVLEKGLAEAVKLMLEGQPLYVGCYGGKGRTGLFLAVLAKAFGVPNPVEFIRKTYYSHAVETEDQYAFVSNFVIPKKVVEAIRKKKRWSWINFMRTNLTVMPPVLVEKKRDEISEALHDLYESEDENI